ncbi:MAG: hypothetical protein COX70_04025 [Flavobacteriales bacterium CG_4_10_14_0_2_um_filter_32_8]|nr:MAG: hypothetical protein COX70_04025 [Flavobacteriales bacterium CG_4_10_14_0_2_um_filter_32_8]PJB14578.1 MAG: hypothetical protein CO118_07865 [Flavobacteriales bacterium CG_4_9_14_3_um_filter_32_8]
MFTSEQKIFALIFLIAFIAIISFQYYIDKKRNKELFKGAYWVLLSVIGLLIFYVLLNKLLH